jgi:hypothetical protein
MARGRDLGLGMEEEGAPSSFTEGSSVPDRPMDPGVTVTDELSSSY